VLHIDHQEAVAKQVEQHDPKQQYGSSLLQVRYNIL
jgi:hypothetical protein